MSTRVLGENWQCMCFRPTDAFAANSWTSSTRHRMTALSTRNHQGHAAATNWNVVSGGPCLGFTLHAVISGGLLGITWMWTGIVVSGSFGSLFFWHDGAFQRAGFDFLQIERDVKIHTLAWFNGALRRFNLYPASRFT